MEHPKPVGSNVVSGAFVKCEPEAAAAPKGTREQLRDPYLRGDKLYATDSYVLVRIPVTLDNGDTDGPVPAAALKAARSNKQFQNVLLNGTAIALSKDGKVEVQRMELGSLTYPECDQLIPDVPMPVEVGLSVSNLVKVAKALGTDAIRLGINPDRGLGPVTVEPLNLADGRIGVVMPVRLPARPEA